MIDVSSPTWATVKAYVTEELKTSRAKLEHESTTGKESRRLRARIAVLTEILALAEPQPVIPSVSNYT